MRRIEIMIKGTADTDMTERISLINFLLSEITLTRNMDLLD